MRLLYLFDTTVFSEPCRPLPNPRIMQKLKQHANEGALASVAWHELRFGAARLAASRRRTELERYLDGARQRDLIILDYDVRAAEWHALERARLEASGRTAPFADGQIAAIAAVNELILATMNARDFAAFRGLRVERWG